MKNCPKCNKQMKDEAKFCPACGADVRIPIDLVVEEKQIAIVPNQLSTSDVAILKELVEKIKFESNLWIIIGILQIVSMVGIICGIYNIVVASKNKKYCRKIMEYPVGIYSSFESMRGCVLILVFNFIFGTMIGVFGSIYHIFVVREYVIKNKDAFDRMDAVYTNSSGRDRITGYDHDFL